MNLDDRTTRWLIMAAHVATAISLAATLAGLCEL